MSALSRYNKLFMLLLYINFGIILADEDKCITIKKCKKCPNQITCEECENKYKLNDDHTQCHHDLFGSSSNKSSSAKQSASGSSAKHSSSTAQSASGIKSSKASSIQKSSNSPASSNYPVSSEGENKELVLDSKEVFSKIITYLIIGFLIIIIMILIWLICNKFIINLLKYIKKIIINLLIKKFI